jgi:PAS domain-containing protein
MVDRRDRRTRAEEEAQRALGSEVVKRIAGVSERLLEWPEYVESAARAQLDGRSLRSGIIAFERKNGRYALQTGSTTDGFKGRSSNVSCSMVLSRGDIHLALNYSAVVNGEVMRVDGGNAELQVGDERFTSYTALERANKAFPEFFGPQPTGDTVFEAPTS